MATIRKRGKTFSVIYGCKDERGNRKQKWESFPTKAKALLRKKEIEYKTELSGTLVIPRCTNLRELLKEYVELYGKEKWALSTFERNGSLISNYIDPIIGDTKLGDISIRFLEAYYQRLLKTPAVPNKARRKNTSGYAGTSTVRDIHKLLRSCFEQAVKWELMERNPAEKATVPKHKSEKREIWTAQTLLYATEACGDADLKVAINLAFSASLRIGELAALTWDCVDISPEAIENGTANIYINKEYQRVSKKAIEQLDGKDILLVFPSQNALSSTVRVLKTPKTESSIRRIYIPKSVAQMLAAHKKKQDELKEMIGSAYHDYNLVMATSYGMPTGGTSLRKRFKKLIQENDLPEVVFHICVIAV